MRAPITGTLSIERRALGTRISERESLGSIQDLLVDNTRLDDLVRERGFVSAEIARLTRTIGNIEGSIEGLRLRAKVYREERVRQLEAQLRSANSQAAAADARVSEAAAAFKRSQQLSDRGLETSASFERIQATQRVAELELEDAKQRAAASEIVLQSARGGTFLGDGYNDSPYSEQQLSELSLRVAELKSNLDAENARAEALDRRIQAERRRVNRLGGAELTSNVNGSVWEVLAGSGETVERGQDIIRLVDCRSTIVTLSVTESVYNRLRLGDAATFKVSGDDRLFESTVTRLAGSGAATIYRNLAIAPSKRHLERYDVTLLAPGLRQDPDLACAIGRTGRVFFEARPLDFLRRLWN
ncbi:HlyD family efflux transporter periplasmic adaptor subunit [Pseudaminobacter sp. NGMCC 1.201702]|uniref:HlyD family efflux transporter periplasmic adaptor subunit n=1 Tax=Pseudaminobacter sp. NGMCC 1.201702 TaxID=3391825 RepID=UPI0039F04B95